jgi:hypothetical protein
MVDDFGPDSGGWGEGVMGLKNVNYGKPILYMEYIQ